MTPREKFINTICCSNYDIPVFCPAIYDYKVNFSDASINLFGQDKDEFIEATKKEFDALDSEVITCGYDIYNVEAEALGSKIVRNSEDIFPEVSVPLIDNLNDIDKLPLLRELKGRMPLFIEATNTLADQFNEKVYVRGAVSGPFSLAGCLYDKEKLITDAMVNPYGVIKLLTYCTEAITTYLNGYLERNLDVVIFDSLASPPMISPEIYRDLIFPFHKKIFEFLLYKGMVIRPLIIGGNTLPIMEYLCNTGANQLLLDYNIPLLDVKTVLNEYNLAFRVNIDPDLVASDNQANIAGYMRQMVDVVGHKPNLLIGTGILMRNVPLSNIHFIRDFLKKEYKTIVSESVSF